MCGRKLSTLRAGRKALNELLQKIRSFAPGAQWGATCPGDPMSIRLTLM